MILWLFQPTQLDIWKMVAPVVSPCSVFLLVFLFLKCECSNFKANEFSTISRLIYGLLWKVTNFGECKYNSIIVIDLTLSS